MKLLRTFIANCSGRMTMAMVFCALASTGCTKELELTSFKNSISGQVTPLVGLLASQNVHGLSCTAVAELYKLTNAGSRILPALQSVNVQSDGNFEFTNVKSLGLKITQTNQIQGQYYVEITGCNKTYGRMLTSTKKQEVAVGSTLVAYLLDTPFASGAMTANHQELNNLFAKLNTYADFATAYSALSNDATLNAEFQQVLGVSPAVLLDASPMLLSISIPDQIHENANVALGLSVMHWTPTYDYAYIWELDGQTLATTHDTTFTPGANDQGQHVLSVFWGQQDTNGDLDLTKPFQTRSYQITITNDLPAYPPALTAITPTVNTSNITLQIATGAGHANCQTFSKLALTEDDLIPPFFASDYTITCTQAPTQNISYTLQNGPGTHTLRLWAMDAAGNLSTTAQTAVVTYSLILPNIAITSPATLTQVKNSVVVSGTCEDTSGDVSFSGGVVAGQTTTCSSGVFSKTVNLSGVDGVLVITASQTNSYGNTGTSSVSITRDTSSPSVTLASSASDPTKTAILVTVTFAEAVTGFDSSDISVTNATVSAFAGTDASYTFTLTPTSEGPFTASVAAGVAQDAATNANLVSNTLTRNYDITAPTITFTSAAIQDQITNTNTVTFTGTCETSLPVVIAGGVDSSTTACTSGSFSYTTASKNTDNSRTYNFAQTDAAGNANNITGTWVRDTVVPTLTLTAPTGGSYKNGSNISITWTSSDDHLLATPIAIEYSSNNGTSWSSLVTNQSNSGSYTWTAPAFNSTTMRVRVKSTDKAGNTTPATSSAFTIDSTPPVVTLTSLTGGQTIRGGVNTTVTWTATDTSLAANPMSIDYSANDGSTWTPIAAGLSNSGSYTWAVPSVSGNTYQIRVSASDLSGNVGQTTSASSFTIDSTAPTVTLTSHTGGQTIPGNGANSTITWTASDAHLGSNPVLIEYSSNSGSTWSTVASGLANSGSYVWTVPTPDTSTGRIKITVTDLVGNATSSSSSSNFIIASSAPVITQTTLANDYSTNSLSSVTFGGACTNGLTIDIVLPDTSTTTTSCTAGLWSWSTPTQSSDGTYAYTFSQTNAAPVTTAVSASWTKDTLSPTISAFYINNSGDTVTANNGVNLTVTTGEATTGLKIRFATPSPDCATAYADSGWQSQGTTTTTTAYSLTIGDGPKTVCSWAKDSAGNVSSASTASISLASGTPPSLTTFEVVNSSGSANDGTTTFASGEQVKITWTAADVEGLSNTPITLAYTTDGSTWTTIMQNYGAASGNPTTYTDTYYWSAPSAGFFRLKITAKDAAGNTSFPALSETMNSGNWSVIAGTNDRGLNGKANRAVLNRYSATIKNFAIHPKTGDIYAFDYLNGLNKIDAKTGIVSRFISNGANDLPSNGTLSASSRVLAHGTVAFDSNGLLYLLAPGGTSTSSTVYQINLDTNSVKRYLGSSSASVFDNTATPTTAFVFYGEMTFDESNSLYFWTHCAAGTWNAANAMRLMKVTQVNGNAGTVSVVAGSCSHGAITSGAVATSSPISTAGVTGGIFAYSSIAAWNNGSTIYFQIGDGSPVRKIINGNIYPTVATCTGNIASAGWGLTYNPIDQKLYVAAGPICKITPNTSGANGETSTVHITTTYTNGCMADGIARTSACVHSQAAIATNAQGNLVFADSADYNSSRPYTLRYIDSTDKIRTLAGTAPFYGDGLDALFARGNFFSIYYKKSGEPNSTAFPSGLYFMEGNGPVFGYIDPSNVVHALAGNQFGNNVIHTNGTDMNMDMSFGSGAYGSLTFTNEGLPAFLYYSLFGGFDDNKKFVQYQSAGGTDWSWYAVGGSPKTAGLYSFGGWQNLTMKGQQLFLLGVRYYASDAIPTPNPVIRIFDFTNNIIKHVMGGTGVTSSDDSITTGSLASSSISSDCQQGGCSQQFIENDSSIQTDDLLYFTEGAKFRVIIDPTTSANNYLKTIFTASSTITNFILSEDQTQVFYIMGGKLYCHDIPTTPAHTAKSWCNDTDLGPVTGMTTIVKSPNQLTWMNSSSLLISTGAGEIYRYNLLP